MSTRAPRCPSRLFGPALFLSLLHLTTARAETPPLRLPLIVHTLQGTAGPVASGAEVRAMVRKLNELYRDAALCFSLEEVRDVARTGALKTYRDRHALTPFAIAGAINVFLVGSIYDPESSESTVRTAARFGFKPDPWLDGAHIEKPGHTPDTYAIVRFASGASVLAHEIGHILGEGHSSVPDNIMGYAAEPTRFDAQQLRTFRAHARQQLQSGALRPTERCEP